jgi:hypothetical protein
VSQENLLSSLTELFRGAGPAHHRAYIETDGFDPEWPLWYADYLREPLGRLLNHDFTKSELVYWLVRVDKEQKEMAPGADWPAYYARFFSQQFGLL